MVVTASLPWWVWLFLIVIFSLQVYSLTREGLPGTWTTGGGDVEAPSIDVGKLKAAAQRNILIIMVISTLFLGFAAYYFMGQQPAMERPYVLLMLHASIFISTISASMSVMNQLNADVPAAAAPAS
jgi:hypothetical protein